jgi:hypothetical protein
MIKPAAARQPLRRLIKEARMHNEQRAPLRPREPAPDFVLPAVNHERTVRSLNSVASRRPVRAPIAADPEMTTHRAYGVPQPPLTPEILQAISATRVGFYARCRTISATAISATPCTPRTSPVGDLKGCG